MASPESRLPIDPNVKVPAAVLRESARSDAIHKQAYHPNAPAAPAPSDPPAPAPAAPPAPAAAAPAPAPAAPVTPTGNEPPAPEPNDWEGRYRASEGRLQQARNTINQQQTTISGLEGRVASMERIMSTMQTAPAPAPVTPPELRASSFVTQEDRETFGEDLLAAARRAAREEFDADRQAMQAEIDNLKKGVGTVTSVVVGNARDKMLGDLDVSLPNWRQQNKDPNFLAWLRLQDPFSGGIRSELLRQAFEANETQRVLAFFKGFLSEEATVAPAAPAAPTSQGGPSLEDFAAPGRAKTEALTPTGDPSAKPIIARAQIAQFYRDVNAGKWRGRDEEKRKTEEMIFAAERDGRIR